MHSPFSGKLLDKEKMMANEIWKASKNISSVFSVNTCARRMLMSPTLNMLQFKDGCWHKSLHAGKRQRLGLIVCVGISSHSWESDSGFFGYFADGQLFLSQAGIMGTSFKDAAASVFTVRTEVNKWVVYLYKSMWWQSNANVNQDAKKKMLFWHNTRHFPHDKGFLIVQ